MLGGLVANVLDADPRRIRVILGDSELCPYGLGSWASRTTFFAGNAALDAAHALARALANLRSELGLGPGLSERVVRGRRGEMLNAGFLDSRIPTFMDTVPINVSFTSTFDPGGPLGAKTIAEPPIIPVAACVANAVHDATGARVRTMP